MLNFKNVQEFVEAVDNSKKVNPADLSSDQDLTVGLMNLIAIEEHLFFSGAKTENTKFYDMIEPVREIRKNLLKKIVGENYEGETWCITKHLLASSMRLMEVGVKQQSFGNKKEAHDLFEQSYNLYCLIWALNTKNDILKIEKNEITGFIKTEIEKIEKNINLNNNNTDVQKEERQNKIEKKNEKSKNSFFDKIKNFVTKNVNCCKE